MLTSAVPACRSCKIHLRGLLAPATTLDDQPLGFFYDLDAYEATLASLREAFPAHWFHASAVKTNPLAGVLRLARAAGHGAECASIGEVEHALVRADRLVVAAAASVRRGALAAHVVLDATDPRALPFARARVLSLQARAPTICHTSPPLPRTRVRVFPHRPGSYPKRAWHERSAPGGPPAHHHGPLQLPCDVTHQPSALLGPQHSDAQHSPVRPGHANFISETLRGPVTDMFKFLFYLIEKYL